MALKSMNPYIIFLFEGNFLRLLVVLAMEFFFFLWGGGGGGGGGGGASPDRTLHD